MMHDNCYDITSCVRRWLAGPPRRSYMKRSLSKLRQDELGSSRFSRRHLLQAAGLAAAAPTFLGRDAFAQAATGQPLRLVCWPLMNGAESQFFYPGGTDATVLSTITEPLRKYAGL